MEQAFDIRGGEENILIRSMMYSCVLYVTGRRQQIAFLGKLLRHQFDSAEETLRQHHEKLRDILLFSLNHVPYYRNEFQRLGLGTADIAARPLEALTALPLLDKATLRRRFDDLKSDDLDTRDWYYNSSGGSTGEPARFVQDAAYHQAAMGSKALFDTWTGYSPGAPKVLLWGAGRDLVGKGTWRSRMGHLLRNEYALNTFRMTEADMRRFVGTINRARPVQIMSYVTSAYQLAQYIEREGLPVYRPKAVMTSAGTLYPHMRETIERAFGAPVFNRYGSREVGDIACECECHRGLHVNPHTHHVEILREDGSPCAPGETGEVVVTSLINMAMPLLRYRIGDMAAWAHQPCSCGRHWPLLKEVSGRVSDVFRRRDGSLVTPAYFNQFFRFAACSDLSFIVKYQLVQEDYTRLRLLLVVNIDKVTAQRLIAEKRQALGDLVRAAMGEDCLLDVQLVDEIPVTASGKFRYIISKLNGNEAVQS